MFESDNAYGDTTVTERDSTTGKPTKKRIRFDKKSPGDANEIADTIKHELRHVEIYDAIGTAGTHDGVDDGTDPDYKKFKGELLALAGTTTTSSTAALTIPTGDGVSETTVTESTDNATSSTAAAATSEPATSGPGPSTTSSTTTTTRGSHTLRVSVFGYGYGQVRSNPAGINCPGQCSHSFPAGSFVTLYAVDSGGSNFGGWSGACSGLTCGLSMGADKSVGATFNVYRN